jgi:hypothetical protein
MLYLYWTVRWQTWLNRLQLARKQYLQLLYLFQMMQQSSLFKYRNTRKYMHAETLALLTKPLYFPNMKYLK